jgi:hypothetical protein
MSMSDPQRPPGRTPPRANPVQPDKPGSGNDTKPAPDDEGRAGDTPHDATKRQAEQSKAALDNVRDGFK